MGKAGQSVRLAERVWRFVRDVLPTLLMVVVGCAALAASGWQAWQTARLLRRAHHAEGVIVDASGHPRIRATDASGRVFEFVQNGFVSRPIGAAIPVVYDPADPAGTAEAGTFWAVWGLAVFPLPMGLGFTLLPLFGARAAWRLGRY